MKTPVELKCIKADMPYFTDNEKNVYYVLSPVVSNQNSLLPAKGKDGLVLKIEGADVNTFFVYPDSLYSKDKNNVYFRDRVVRKANPETFEIISPQFQKDNEHVWYMGSLLCADSKTFRVFTCERAEHPEKRMSLYACDKNHVFYQYLILDDADLKTFRVLKSAISDELYGVDEKRVFYHHMYLEYADAKTFRVVTENDRFRIDHPEADAYDINYKYTCGNRIPVTEKEKHLLFL